jgi:YgiT-type zinc finger domain-containing protein
MINITRCPSCGSKGIKKVKRNWTGNFTGQIYIVPDLEFHECPTCGEELYDAQAMRKIEAYSPAYAKKRMRKKAA